MTDLSWTKGETEQQWHGRERDKEGQTQKTSLGKNKEILDAEIWGISEAVKGAERKCRDSQTAINKLKLI